MQTAIVTNKGESTELVDMSDNRGLVFVHPDDMPDLNKAEVGMNIEKKYYEFRQIGDVVRAVYNGMDYITTNKKDAAGNKIVKRIPSVVFQTKDGVFLNSGASLVEQFKNIPPGTAIQITYKGEVRTSGGNDVKKYDVNILNIKVPAQAVSVASVPHAPAAKNDDVIQKFWDKAYSLGFTQQDGLDHLAEHDDYSAALAALG